MTIKIDNHIARLVKNISCDTCNSTGYIFCEREDLLKHATSLRNLLQIYRHWLKTEEVLCPDCCGDGFIRDIQGYLMSILDIYFSNNFCKVGQRKCEFCTKRIKRLYCSLFTGYKKISIKNKGSGLIDEIKICPFNKQNDKFANLEPIKLKEKKGGD